MTPWIGACQVLLFMEFSSQEYWHGLPYPSSRDLLDPGIEPRSPALQADSLPFEEALCLSWVYLCVLVPQLCLTLCDSMDCSPPGPSIHRSFPGKTTGVGHCSLLQRIFLTQGSNSGLPHCRQILCHLSHWGNPLVYHGWILIVCGF